MLERVISGAVSDGQRRGAIEVETGRQLDDVIGRDRGAFSRGVEIGVAHHAVAWLEPINARADAFDHARELAARREWERRFGLVLAGNDEGIEKKKIQTERRHFSDDFARTGDRIGDVGKHEIVGRAEALAENSFHIA